MEIIERIKAHYGFTPKDAENLRRLLPVVEKKKGSFTDAFYGYIKNLEEAGRFLKDEETIRKHKEAVGDWLVRLFGGEYGPEYFMELERVGMAHVKIELSPHYVNSAMHFVKGYLADLVKAEVRDEKERIYALGSLEKILDINLDVFTSSYVEEERRVFLFPKVESYLIQFARRFSYGLNLVLVAGLVILGFLVMGLFVYDVTHIFAGEIEKGLLATLGSLLMLWIVIELMDTQIQHLRGKKFAIKVFISVALVAVIRKILVTTVAEEALGAQLSLVAGVAVLGAVYWLISKAE
jgi:uncharacterized membrane protein (DUF373 family)